MNPSNPAASPQPTHSPAPASAPAAAWPDGPLLAYLGDDFTGSTDVMEAFTAAGVPTVLFLSPPAPHWVERFKGMRAIGLATTARGQNPAWMDANLPGAFAKLQAFGAPILQYKVCSTFDSSPDIGSIGRAIDIGTRLMPGRWSPMVVGAPRLRRFQAFGNLFAIADGADGPVGHRLDRHPTMSRHPVTPMHEADLRLHLGAQTQRRLELIDLAQSNAGAGPERRDAIACTTPGPEDAPVVLIDVVDEATLAEAGRLVWQGRAAGLGTGQVGGLFSASSSGLQYALAAHWRAQGLLPAVPSLPVARPVDTIAVVSGSCSPATAEQIDWARSHGFTVLRLDIAKALHPASHADEIERLVSQAAALLSNGTSPLIASAEGPNDPAVTGFDAIAHAAGLSRTHAAEQVGVALAQVMRQLLDRAPALKRIVVAGGDSSGAVAGALEIDALSVVAGLAPGVPLCRAWSDNPRRDGLQIALKSGQLGGLDFFGRVKTG
jgi:3-oxoisoapionate kinase